tara:strand:+ start:273 stop:641 length:369 start_codon:yes stop_codon:yes gene_type:complete
MFKKSILFTLGMIFIGFAYIGIILPGLPTTPFILLAVYFFSKSSNKMENWILNHKLFGDFIYNWKKNRAISKKSKIYAIISILITFSITIYKAFSIQIDLIFVIICLLLCSYIITRPTPLDE